MASVTGRLRTAAEFQHVYRTGRAFRGRGFTVRVAPAADTAAPSAFGYVVGTKVSKSAVVRNRIRRRAREFVHRNAGDIAPGRAIAVIAAPAAAAMSPSETVGELSSLFKQATLVR